MGVVATGAISNNAGSRPAVQAFAMCTALPVFGLLEVALAANLVGVVEVNRLIIQRAQRAHLILGVVAGEAVEQVVGMNQVAIPMGCT